MIRLARFEEQRRRVSNVTLRHPHNKTKQYETIEQSFLEIRVHLLGDRLRGRDGGRVERGGGEGRGDRPSRGGSDVVAEVSHGPARQYPLLLGRALRLGEGEEGERASRGDRLLPLALQRDERVRPRPGHLGGEGARRVRPVREKYEKEERGGEREEKPEETPDLILGLCKLPAQQLALLVPLRHDG